MKSHASPPLPSEIDFATGHYPESDPKIGFSETRRILGLPVWKMLRISPRSFLAWFWSLLFLTFFGVWIFPGCFPKKGALGKVGAAAGGGGAPLFGAPGPKNIKNKGLGGLGGGGAYRPL